MVSFTPHCRTPAISHAVMSGVLSNHSYFEIKLGKLSFHQSIMCYEFSVRCHPILKKRSVSRILNQYYHCVSVELVHVSVGTE